MKILTWNVNGLRAREKAGFLNTIETLKPDIFCLQETRCTYEQMRKDTFEFLTKDPKTTFLSCHQKKGYAGVLTCVDTPVTGFPHFGTPNFYAYDTEENEDGRQYLLGFENFELINVYSPNSGRDLEKLDHRTNWEIGLLQYAKRAEKPLIICGDMNVAPDRMDCNVFSKAGTSKEERACFNDLKERAHLVDVWRKFNPLKQGFTWHSNQYDSFANNKGMRIDHFLVSESIIDKVNGIEIIEDQELIAGSDHCPVLLDINI